MKVGSVVTGEVWCGAKKFWIGGEQLAFHMGLERSDGGKDVGFRHGENNENTS